MAREGARATVLPRRADKAKPWIGVLAAIQRQPADKAPEIRD